MIFDILTIRVLSNDQFYLNDQNLKMEQLLNDLSKLLNITNIYRIETVDISHFYGQNVYGSLIVFENNYLKKDKYRIFKLHYSFDDLSNIQELLQRRIKYLLYSEKYKDKSLNIFPQLIIIDDGKNQLKVANNIINKHFQYLIKVISIVKPEDKILFYLDDQN